jgi:hypothetical protein
MSKRKFPVLNGDCTDIDPLFLVRMLGACHDGYERGLVRILDLTGMHVSKLRTVKLVKQGDHEQLEWERTKTSTGLSRRVPKEAQDDVHAFLEHRPVSRQHYRDLIVAISDRAGYEGVSPMTFRHNQTISSLKRHHYNPIVTAQDMGCDYQIVLRNYAKLSQEQIEKGGEEE